MVTHKLKMSLLGHIRFFIEINLRYLLSFLNFKKRYILIRDWNRLKSFKRKDRVVVIAGGPSFSKEIAKFLIQKRHIFDIACINSYDQSSYSEELVPDYYFLSDPLNTKLNYETEEEKENDISRSRSVKKYILQKKIKLIAPYNKLWNSYTNVFCRFDDSENIFTKNIDPRFPRGYPSNTAFKAIAGMLFLNYKEIYIVGFDYNYPNLIRVDNQNRLFHYDEHHYGEAKKIFPEDFEGIAHALRHWADDYWYLKKLKSNNVTNVTNSSFVDVFDKEEVEDFIARFENK